MTIINNEQVRDHQINNYKNNKTEIKESFMWPSEIEKQKRDKLKEKAVQVDPNN